MEEGGRGGKVAKGGRREQRKGGRERGGKRKLEEKLPKSSCLPLLPG